MSSEEQRKSDLDSADSGPTTAEPARAGSEAGVVATSVDSTPPRTGHAGEVFWRFALLGLSSFGGPAAHLGYFRRVFVSRLGWQSEAQFARLVALSQFLPGPGSSQVAFGLGVHRAGVLGGIAAFLAFTTPSFLLMLGLSRGSHLFGDSVWLTGLISGLKLLAVVVVADATLSMAKLFWGDRARAGIGVLTAVALLLLPTLGAQLGVLLLAAVAGAWWLEPREIAAGVDAEQTAPLDGDARSPARAASLVWLVLFGVLFGLSFVPSFADLGLLTGTELFADFYQAGALVFGGGHVVLPLLENLIGDALATDRFLTGYAAAQGVPGPMFSLAAFLGAEIWETRPVLGALVATLGIFLPGSLLVLGLMPIWERVARRPKLRAVADGLNAAVVGLLLAALYSPVFVAAVDGPREMALVVAGFALLRGLRWPVVALVAIFAAVGLLAAIV